MLPLTPRARKLIPKTYPKPAFCTKQELKLRRNSDFKQILHFLDFKMYLPHKVLSTLGIESWALYIRQALYH